MNLEDSDSVSWSKTFYIVHKTRNRDQAVNGSSWLPTEKTNGLFFKHYIPLLAGAWLAQGDSADSLEPIHLRL